MQYRMLWTHLIDFANGIIKDLLGSGTPIMELTKEKTQFLFREIMIDSAANTISEHLCSVPH